MNGAKANGGDRTGGGVGFSINGQARSGMGVDSADFNGDDGKIFVANVDQEMIRSTRTMARNISPMSRTKTLWRKPLA